MSFTHGWAASPTARSSRLRLFRTLHPHRSCTLPDKAIDLVDDLSSRVRSEIDSKTRGLY